MSKAPGATVETMSKAPQSLDLIDTHCHLTFKGLIEDVDGVLDRAEAEGVRHCITVGTDIADTRAAIALARKFDNVWATAGVHPHEAGKIDETTWPDLADLLTAEHIVALGETGLDYHYDFSDRDSQRSAFARQVALAEERGLPLVIHCREAVDDALAVLSEQCRYDPNGVFHCFTGSRDQAVRILDAGWHISLSGIATFKNASAVRDAARTIPRDRLLLETDAPFNSPEPVRKIRPNEPALLTHTCQFLADLHGVAPETLAEQCNATAIRLFGLNA